MQNLSDRHPFLTAREAFLAGRIHSAQAIGMAAKDREFIAESELKGLVPLEAARDVIAGPWMRRRLECLKHDVPRVAS